VSPPLTDSVPWSRQRWLWTVVIVLLLQLAAVYILSDFRPIHRRQPPPSAHLLLITQPMADRQLALSFATQDPTLFALAGKSNFSGTAWLNLKPIQHRLYSWKDRSFWIEPRIEFMRQLPAHLIAQAALPDSISDLKPLPRLQDLFVTNEAPCMESLLRVEGSLTNRLLSLTHNLPVFSLDRPLHKTIIHVAVDAKGKVISARLWESSGLPNADAKALQYAKSLTFKPLPSPEENQPADFSLAWSFLIFEWATVDAPLSSNSPAAPSS
jgi:TonB family protein